MNFTRLLLLLLVGASLSLPCLSRPVHAKPKPVHAKPKRPAQAKPKPPVSTPAALFSTGPWRSKNIGKVGVPGGTFFYNNGAATILDDVAVMIQASGEDIFGKADSFRFTFRPLLGDGQIVAQVVAYDRQDMWTKVGVMVRDSDAPGAKFADIVLTPDKGAEFQWRAGTDGETQTSEQTPAPAPYWVKLTRTGDVFVGWISPDGKTWTERGRATISMGPNVLAGICVTSHKNDTLTQATFESVTVTPAARH